MQRHVQRMVDHLWGPTGSIILHILIIFMLYKFVRFVRSSTAPDVEVVIMDPDAIDLDEILEPEEIEQMEDIVDTVTPPDIDMSVEQPEVENFESEPEDFEALEITADVESPLVMRGLFANRSQGGRNAALSQFNSKYAKITEAAVIRALEWLKRHQEADGSWGKKHRTAKAGLGLLAFLAHGETPGSERYGPTVEKALRYLIGRQQEGGLFHTDGGHSEVYEHAIATYAISEAYGITRIPDLKPAMEKAAGVILRGQQPNGAWDYFFAKKDRCDLSISGWLVQALKAAKAAGAETPGLDEGLAKAAEGVKQFQTKEGNFGYSNKNLRTNRGLTGVGVLCLQLLGQGNSGAAQQGLRQLRNETCSFDEPGEWPFYGWYYVAQARFHEGKFWDDWNRRMVTALVPNQNSDGSWSVFTEEEKRQGDATYATTLAALTLQVYYRFLPTYKADAVKSDQEPESDAMDDDVEIEII